MAKKKKSQAKSRSAKPVSISAVIQQYQYGFVFLILLLFLLTLRPQMFEGKAPSGVDFVQHIAKMNQPSLFYQQTGEHALWHPWIFAGMPIYHRVTTQWTAERMIISIFDRLGYIEKKGYIVYEITRVLLWMHFFLFLGFGMVLLLRLWNIPIGAALFAAIGMLWLPHYGVLFKAGHLIQIRALYLIPFIVWAFERIWRERNWRGWLRSALLFALLFSIQLQTRHYQIIFYLMLFLFFLFIGHLFEIRRLKRGRTVWPAAAALAAAVLLSLLMSLQTLAPMREYAPLSIRGGGGDSGTDGLEYDYATNWSWAPAELLSLLIPNAYGGASTVKYSGSAVPQLKGQAIPGYWGQMPFTEGGEYIGVLLLILAALGAAAGIRSRSGPVIAMVIFVPFGFLLSFGRHLPLLYDLFFNYAPFFNKFRIPSMVLLILYFVFFLLAALGVKALVTSSERDRRTLLRTVVAVSVFCLFFGLLPFIARGLFSFVREGESARYGVQVLELIRDARYDLMKSDALRLLLLTLVTGGTLVLFLKTRISRAVMLTVLCLIFIYDFHSVAKRTPFMWTDVKNMERTVFVPSQTEQFLLKQSRPFRLFPLQANVFTNNLWSYNDIESIGGYSPAKLRIFQDLVDEVFFTGSPVNWNIINMLDGKFVVSNRPVEHPKLEQVHFDEKVFTAVFDLADGRSSLRFYLELNEPRPDDMIFGRDI